ncbi:Flp family type IVb pilin [Methylobacterium mesophilicum]|uniref:Flp family type IVb pilin n=1 Tax=Methylobacterium mesophilicum TaxID=39956 RepID=UPI001EE1AEB0|nr:hypothetical protein [Methylobacterium mesophilicum]GJE21113.1 hypothetical protein JHFBIEKO_1554 [Methylobacterium mesophilicum]
MAEPSCEGSKAASGRSRSRGRDLARRAPSRFAADARGSTAMEYALIGALIFIVAAGSIRYYGSRMTPIYERISTTVSQAN